jgi:gas vesicle protein
MASGNGDLFKGFLLGGLIGFAAGVLFAPKSGKDTREELKGESGDLIGRAKEELEKIKTELGDMREKITETIDRGKGIFEQPQTDEERDFEAEINSMDSEMGIKQEEPEKKKSSPRKKSAAKKNDKA